MLNNNIKLLSNVILLIALYYLVYYIFTGFLNPIPALGDSWDYHIPIQKTILDGRFLHPSDFKLPQWYYPGSSEAINSLFILLNIPLTLSNLFASLILFVSCLKLALCFKLQKYYALIFALAFCTLNVVLRWLNAVSIDVWIGVFFVLTIILFENPKKSSFYFGKVGFVTGMLIGSKYTAVLFLIPLFILYFKDLLRVLNIKRFIFFMIPFSIFGLYWYIRNFVFTNNPFYPLPLFGFEGLDFFGSIRIFTITLEYPIQMLNAAFSEYNIWLVSILIALFVIIRRVFKKDFRLNSVSKLFLIGIMNLVIFLNFPTSSQPWIMVSSFRYSLPAFIPLILGVFILASEYKKEELISLVVLGSMVNVISMQFYPKLTLIYLPIGLMIIYLLNKKEKSLKRK